MQYYKDENNNVYGYEKEGLIPITEEEANELLKPKLEDIIPINKSIKSSLITQSTLKINILQDAIDLDMSLDGDEDKLKSWKKYRVLLSRVDTNVENMELPEKPE